MFPWVGSHAPCCGRQLWGLPSCVEYLSPQGVLPRESTVRSPHPFGSSCGAPLLGRQPPPGRHACHQLLPCLRVMFAMVPDAAWPGSDQWPCSTAHATGLVGWLGSPTASAPGGVDRCVLSLCRPRCVCVCGVLAYLARVHWCARPLCFVRDVCGHVAPVHRCARCVWYACAGGGFVPPRTPPPFFRVLCICFFLFVLKWKRGRVHTAGTGMGN